MFFFYKGLSATAWLVKRPSDWLSVAPQLVKFYKGLSAALQLFKRRFTAV